MSCGRVGSVTRWESLIHDSLFIPSRGIPTRQPADEAAGGGDHQGSERGERSQEQHGTGPVSLGLLHRLPQLPAGVAGAELRTKEPWPESRGTVSSTVHPSIFYFLSSCKIITHVQIIVVKSL